MDRIVLQDNDNEVRIDENFYEPQYPIGPIELNLLDRVELGLNASLKSDTNKDNSCQDEKEKYSGPKEVIFVSGWVNINSIYSRYLWSFIGKIFIGMVLFYCLTKNDHNFFPLALVFLMISLAHFLKNIYYLRQYKESNKKLKFMFWVEFHISLGYLLYFLGFVLIFTRLVPTSLLFVFSAPFFLISLFLFVYTPQEENMYINQKRFLFFEAIQLSLISIKFSQPNFLNWNYTLMIFLFISIYLLVLGILMSIILSCSVFGLFYREIETWKVKALIWMTWYYLSTGMVYIYLIKGAVRFFNEKELFGEHAIDDYLIFQSQTFEILLISSLLLVLFSIVNLVFHLLWKEEIKKYLTKVIYKNELRKEISLRFLRKNFTFKLIQVSTTYFMKSKKRKENESNQNSELNEEVKENIQKKSDDQELSTKENGSKSKSKNKTGKDVESNYENELCVFCYENSPNIMIDPCCHGGICKECTIHYLKNDEGKCPFCKGQIKKLFLLYFDQDKKQLFAKGEIKLQT